MKKFFTFIICVAALQLMNADSSYAQSFNADTAALLPVKEVAVSKYQDVIFKRRLDSIQKDVPLDYNGYVQGYIDVYMSRRDEIGRFLGLSKYYFPIYEKAFRDAGVPEEIKYLSIVESALNPNAVSRVGAAGPWQFMSETAKIYHLKMNDYVDERRDPVQSSQAAAAYLRDAYQQFGDWLLAIASYNCGKSNVENALAKTGATDYWSIRQLLPAETRGYVPAYIAITYTMNYYKRHGIYPQPTDIPMENDTVSVSRLVPMSRIATALGIDLKDVVTLNPSYRMLIVNGSSAAPRRILVPHSRKERFTVLAQAIDNPNYVIPAYRPVYVPPPVKTRTAAASAAVPPGVENMAAQTGTIAPAIVPRANMPHFHTTVKGDTLATIATKYGIRVEDLMGWNKQLGNNKNIPLVAGLTVNLSRG
ncbi:lytic transglycosylase domain-containing protein [Mucilaginibacter gilvus]|uniref:LysM peptidoglycan-binding domain-containing protein n=1 Tax=Mucilaginibacter gilvus TaxID=2305909 RepID=A0A3S3YYX5_9SPHI|nr:lytic transglycosylase domain-containing protein [Mucilaginibacter gilvus]RWY49152.1 LysM peptidoglycan-binding domain-containing protein [Mucilaginibacter gilvus]